MAHTSSARIIIQCLGSLTLDGAADPGAEGTIQGNVDNGAGGQSWTDGTGSGQIDRIYRRERTITMGATHSYNMLAAGSLTDIYGQAIDADEIKGLAVKVTSGAIKLEAPAANFLPIFADASDVILLQNGTAMAFSWGDAGLSLTTNASFDVTETTGAASATYELWAIVAQ